MGNGQKKYTRDQHRVSDLTDLLFWERKIDVVEFQGDTQTICQKYTPTRTQLRTLARTHTPSR